MRLLVLGTAEFAVPTLRACAAAHQVLAVVTQPERPGHRGRPAPRPVARAAEQLGIAVLQPARVRDPATVDSLLAYGADALVVAAYGQILPETLLTTPPHGGVNVHASLLPRWRGAAPVAAAILAGDAETGVSIMRMDAGLDTGPVYLQGALPLPAHTTTPELTEQLAALGAAALLEVLAQLQIGGVQATPQDESLATYAPRLTRGDSELDWSACSGEEVDRRVRALQPWPGVVAPLAGARVHLLRGAAAAGSGDPGAVLVIDTEHVVVAAREGAYRIEQLRAPSGRAMSAAAFLRGRRQGAA